MKLFSISDAARLTGIDEPRIHYAHRSGKVLGPTYFVAGRRIYTDSDVRRVAEFFGVPVDQIKELEDEENNSCSNNMNM